MNERQLDELLRAASAAEPPPAFSPIVHERVMERVRREAGGDVTRPGARRYWIGLGTSAAVAAGIALAMNGLAWRSAAPTDSAPIPRDVFAALAAPSEVVTRSAQQAQQRIDSMVATSDVASLDRDAIRLTQFVVGQLRSLRLPPNAVEPTDPAKRL